MAVEAPGELRAVLEPAWAREVHEPQSPLAKRRVGLPEALVAPEVGEAGVDPHSGPGGDEKGPRSRDRLDRALDLVHAAIVSIPAAGVKTAFGRKYTVIGVLTGPVGVVQVVTVWLEEPGRAGVRLVTVQPR